MARFRLDGEHGQKALSEYGFHCATPNTRLKIVSTCLKW
jgi:hypothetical protein